MNFKELSQELQQKFFSVFKEHIHICKNILNEDHSIEPMLRINSVSDPMLISLQPKDGKFNFLKVLEKTKEILNSQSFETAVLSYSSSSVLKKSDAVVSCLIDKSGVGVLFFTAYHFSGLFKKKVVYDEHIIGDVIDDAL